MSGTFVLQHLDNPAFSLIRCYEGTITILDCTKNPLIIRQPELRYCALFESVGLWNFHCAYVQR